MRMCAGKLFHSAGAEAWNERAPKVVRITPFGRSKNIVSLLRNEYLDDDLIQIRNLLAANEGWKVQD